MATAETLTLVRRETLVDTVARALLSHIADKGLQAGDRLPSERQLVEMLGVSRLPLREALSLLRGLGVIEVRHGKGIFVKKLDLTALFGMLSPLLRTQGGIELTQIFEARMELESSIARLAASSFSEETRRRLEEAVAGMRESVRDRPSFVRHDMAFHLELARSTGNPIFEIFMASVTDLLQELQHLYRNRIEFRRRAVSEHEAILASLFRKDGQAAAEAMKSHLANAMTRL